MDNAGQVRYCRCGTRLARDNSGPRCHACQKAAWRHRLHPPPVPADFWHADTMRSALATRDMGTVMRAFRTHPDHGAPIPQEIAAGWVGLSQSRLSRVEQGGQPFTEAKLMRWADTLGLPQHLRWFTSSGESPPAERYDVEAAWGAGAPRFNRDGRLASGSELDDMNRRELLRLLSMVGVATMLPVDIDRVAHAATRPGSLDLATVDEYETLNIHMWGVFGLSKVKRTVLPLVRQQLAVLIDSLNRPQPEAVCQRLTALTADLLQLAGEVWFDGNRYTEAAQCYTLAASASQAAGHFDLWACALTRHAFIGLYERRFANVRAMLDFAAQLAQRGDSSLSTRHWVAVVQAETFAGLGDMRDCERALDTAEGVHQLPGHAQTGGWLRFDGSRLSEERGTCYVTLGQPELAEQALNNALDQNLSPRRWAAVCTDLALVGVQRHDAQQVIRYATSALDMAASTDSGYVGRKLRQVRQHLAPLLASHAIRQLDQRLAELATV